MKLPRFDLPLRERAASRFLPWTIGGLLYVALVALAVAAIADDALRSQGMRVKMATVTLPSVEDAGRDERQLSGALAVLGEARGVVSAAPVPAEEVAALVEPWLGEGEIGLNLPLPRLIDLTLDPSIDFDREALEQRLRDVVEGATIGAEVVARDRAERFATFIRAWGAVAGVVALLLNFALVGLITRTSLLSNAKGVELLRCLGASDGYLARQFERHALLSSVQGGLAGFVLAVATVLAILYSSNRMQLADAIELHLPALDWLLLACVPPLAALLTLAVARMTALWGLTRSP